MFDLNSKILVVDDYSTMRNITKHLLKNIGFNNIHDADNGKAALQKLKDGNFDLVISDWNMPVMDGYKLLRAVRANNFYRHIPFLMVTAEMKREQVIAAAKAGVDAYIAKPFNRETLRDKLERMSAKYENTN